MLFHNMLKCVVKNAVQNAMQNSSLGRYLTGILIKGDAEPWLMALVDLTCTIVNEQIVDSKLMLKNRQTLFPLYKSQLLDQ